MTRARDIANLGTQAESGLDASDITTGVLPVGVTGGSGLTHLASNPTVTLGSNATFPSGHVVQTVYGSSTGVTSSTTTGTSILASHLTKDIQITAGNTIRWTFNFAHNMMATDGSAYQACKWYMYHKVDGGTFADIYNGDYVGSFYQDVNGNLPSYTTLTANNNFTGIHTPSSDTHHHYTLYYKFEVGWFFEMGITAGANQQHVILEEIQA
ncbi:MAG: hypothetical protein Unbinned2902contig1001_51 [Prokaryotic dsDNA virus sp.]|mgnify:CR=1 FL=1|nr:MAG: hypothetical protein Unbinned2902contig1001_51 [Prokaryotic dsDNA virus sp.]|tara:strand:- start:35664 stop:36296 length:633 start_codon:yes stop_codon:yes gene_type:complete